MPIKEYTLPVPSWCPPGWLPCDGREISKKFYPDLYAAYNHMRFGGRIPDLRSAVAYGHGAPPITIERVISFQNLKRPNGVQMIAGVIHDIAVARGEA